MASPKPKVTPKPKPKASPQATKKSEVVVTTGRGSTIKMGDLGRATPTPTAKPRIGVIKEYSPKEYQKLLEDIVKQNKNR
jgi:hypothetical protein